MFRDLRIIHRERAKELARGGYSLHMTGVSYEKFVSLCRAKSLPVKSIHLFAIDEIWSPIGAVNGG